MPSNNTRTIARNSFWFGLELFAGIIGAFLCSVLVARIIGPVRLGYFSYMVWLTNVTATVGTFGLPMTARKYMAEQLNRGEAGRARTTYLATLRLQSWIAVGITAVGLGLVLAMGNPEYRIASILLVLNVAPRVISCIPSQANNAAEAMRRNTGPSLICGATNVSVTLFSLWMGWGLIGVAAAVCLASFVECFLKLRSVENWMGGVARDAVPEELRKRMLTYSTQGLALMLLNLVVWDRSDIIFLKALNGDVRQVTFFSIAFNLSERMLMVPHSFGHSLGATMMAQYGRAKEKIQELAVDGARYALLVALPLLGGLACISKPVVLMLYGEPYRPLIPALTIAAAMAIPKAVVNAPTLLLQTTEKQGFLVFWNCVCGAFNVVLDILLTPRYGAIGAAVANGSAQTLAAVGICLFAWRVSRFDPRLPAFGRLLVCGVLMVAGVFGISRWVAGPAGVAISVGAGAAIWLGSLRMMRALTAQDAERFLNLGRSAPAAVRPYVIGAIRWLAPGKAA